MHPVTLQRPQRKAPTAERTDGPCREAELNMTGPSATRLLTQIWRTCTPTQGGPPVRQTQPPGAVAKRASRHTHKAISRPLHAWVTKLYCVCTSQPAHQPPRQVHLQRHHATLLLATTTPLHPPAPGAQQVHASLGTASSTAVTPLSRPDGEPTCSLARPLVRATPPC